MLGGMGEAPEKIGRYEVLKTVGRGAMGIVYKARDPLIGRTVALKRVALPPGFSEEQRTEFAQRFFHEAKAAGNLSHPNIVTIYDVGEDGGVPFMAQEFVEGQSLGQRLKARGALSPEEALPILRQVASGLDYAHGCGVVHRDIKPDNILLDAKGRAVISDFGVAHLESSDLTRTGEVLGTPHFMSPEQVMGQPLDGRSDLFSLGVVMYQMLAGQRPFRGDTVSTICYQIVHGHPEPDPVSLSVTPESSRILARLLAKRREDRFATGADLVAALDEAMGALDPSATRPLGSAPGPSRLPAPAAVPPQQAPTVKAPPMKALPTVVPPPAPKGSFLTWMVVGALVLLAIVVAGGLASRIARHLHKPLVQAAGRDLAPARTHPGAAPLPAGSSQQTGPGPLDTPDARGVGGQGQAILPPAASHARMEPSPPSRRPKENELAGSAVASRAAAVPNIQEGNATRSGQSRVVIEISGPIVTGGFGILVDGKIRIERQIREFASTGGLGKQGFKAREEFAVSPGEHTLAFAVRPGRYGAGLLTKEWAVALKEGGLVRLRVQVLPRQHRIIVRDESFPQ